MTSVDIGSIPQDCWNLIFEKLDAETLESIQKTSKLFQQILEEYEKTHPNWRDDQDERDYGRYRHEDSDDDRYPVNYNDYDYDDDGGFNGLGGEDWEDYLDGIGHCGGSP